MIIDHDIESYTAYAEEQLRMLRNCNADLEIMYRDQYIETENVRLALIQLKKVYERYKGYREHIVSNR